MTGTRFPGLELSEWRSRVVGRHPRLFPDAQALSDEHGEWLCSAGWPVVDDGWRTVVETLCQRLDAVAEKTAGSIAVLSIDEKYAEMRVDVSCDRLTEEEVSAVEVAIELAEGRSGETCAVCGERGGAWELNGWLLARCDLHGLGVRDTNPLRSLRLSFRTEEGRTTRIARIYRYDRDAFVVIEHPSEAE